MSDLTDFAPSLARMHLTLAEMLADAIQSAAFPRVRLLELSQLTETELALIEEGDTSDLTNIAALLHALKLRLVLNPNFTVAIEPVFAALML